ncbi:MAG: hypothetical protein NE330_08340 [Lentisphaeraceae bacterium]|nr:hypothetical protein [Lentisphaeraceae bacterium]
MILKAILICSLYKLLLSSESSILSAVLYTVFCGVLAIITSGLIAAAITVVISFVISFTYFGLLNKFQDGLSHYVILLVGLPICLLF